MLHVQHGGQLQTDDISVRLPGFVQALAVSLTNVVVVELLESVWYLREIRGKLHHDLRLTVPSDRAEANNTPHEILPDLLGGSRVVNKANPSFHESVQLRKLEMLAQMADGMADAKDVFGARKQSTHPATSSTVSGAAVARQAGHRRHRHGQRLHHILSDQTRHLRRIHVLQGRR